MLFAFVCVVVTSYLSAATGIVPNTTRTRETERGRHTECQSKFGISMRPSRTPASAAS